jgi:hypothetical protein
MFPLEMYKIIHILGILMLFMSVGGLLTKSIVGENDSKRWRKQLTMNHGIGLLLILLGGFGMLAKLGILWPMPGWVMAKLIIWVILGGLLFLILKSNISKLLWYLVILLGILAGYFAIMKPI